MHILYGNLLIFEKFALALQYISLFFISFSIFDLLFKADKNTISLVIEDSTVLFIYIMIVSKTIRRLASRYFKMN
jgi:hypothetical protein